MAYHIVHEMPGEHFQIGPGCMSNLLQVGFQSTAVLGVPVGELLSGAGTP